MNNITSENGPPYVVILGAGESGVGAALLARQMGYPVFVSDKGIIAQPFAEELLEKDIPFEDEGHTPEKILSADLVVKSPGIPETNPLVKQLVDMGVQVISEIEFAYRHAEGTIIGITGSNGKTTTTMLIGHLLRKGGLNVGVGGNIGHSFARMLTEDKKDYYVLELSSFQLDGIQDFRPHVAVLLNISADHLDRYNYSMKTYIQSKFRIILNQKKEDVFIYNKDDDNISSFFEKTSKGMKCIPFGKENIHGDTVFVNETVSFNLKNCSLKGPHNRFNALCAIQIALLLNISHSDIYEGLNSFVNAPHRLEFVATINGVDYINDSKGTNVDAVYYALNAMEKPVIWMAGGLDKGNDYVQIMDLVREKVKALVCLGADNSPLLKAFSGEIARIEETNTAENAVLAAARLAQKGDVVLLSPACSSFDLFKNYAYRGDAFKAAVHKLKMMSA